MNRTTLRALRLHALGWLKRIAGRLVGSRLLEFEGQLASMSARLLRAPAREETSGPTL